jgi:DNA-binding LacI/PurR family transcriptional regulator
VHGSWSAEFGYEAGRRLAADPKLTAVFTANDQIAIGLLLALHEAGRRVPDDVSVVGFDDQPEAAYLVPPLTTVRQDFEQVGARAVAAITSAIAEADAEVESSTARDPSTPEPVVANLIAPELVVRRSTGPVSR